MPERTRKAGKDVREIRLPSFGIVIRLSRENARMAPGSGMITSDLKPSGQSVAERFLSAAIDGLESLILAHACAGVNVESPVYLEGIETAVEAIFNHYVP